MFHVYTLGRISVSKNGGAVKVNSAKSKALLSYLCVNKGRVYTRDFLADLLWQQSSLPKAKHSLNQSLYAIRRILPEFIISDQTTVRCNSEVVITDIDELSVCLADGRAIEALLGIKGEFLADLILDDAPDFEEWRSEYNRELFGHLNELAKIAIKKLPLAQRNKEVLQFSSRSIDLFPAIKSAWQDAVNNVEVRKGAFVRERNVQNADAAASRLVTPLAGRTNHLRVLSAQWKHCVSHQAAFVVVAGTAGCGKTRLVQEFLLTLPPGSASIIRGRCYESERRLSFAPISEGLSSSLKPHDLKGLDSLWLSALHQIIPTLVTDTEPLPQLSAIGSQTRVFESFLRLAEHLSATKPVVIFIDDVQWADNATRAGLSYLFHRLDRTRVYVIVTLRTKNSDHAMDLPWDEWRRISVKELHAEEIRSLLLAFETSTQIAPPSVEAMVRLTGGNPFLVNEVLRCVVSGKIANVNTIRARNVKKGVGAFASLLLKPLSSSAKRIIGALSVLERPTQPSLIQKVAAVDHAAAHIDILLSRGLVTVGKSGVSLRHDLIREYVYARLQPFTRARLHSCAARELAQRPKRAGESAYHFFKAGERSHAYKYALAASAEADSRFANDESISFLRLAIKTRPPQRKQTLRALAERLYRAHRMEEAQQVLNKLHYTDEPIGRSQTELQLLKLEVDFELGTTPTPSLLDRLYAIKQGMDNADVGLQMRALRLENRFAYCSGVRPTVSRCIDEGRRLGAQCDTPDAIEAFTFAARLHSSFYSSREAEEWVAPVSRQVDHITDHELRIRIKNLLGGIAFEAGRLKKAERIHSEVLLEIEKIGEINLWPITASNVHMLLVEQGIYDRAEVLSTEMRRRVGTRDATRALSTLATNEALMNYELGQFDAASQAIDHAITFKAGSRTLWMDLALLGLKGLLALEAGRLSEARVLAMDGKRQLDSLGFRAADMSPLEILIARVTTIEKKQNQAVERLRDAIEDYLDRDVMCRLRLKMELARSIKSIDRRAARAEARSVYDTATAINAQPIAERADALLLRL